ncbi:MAG TPA: MFS transporter [Vicinamibacterales bacterium]|jgi:EmrB/QacA subfamily drug resistance transporter|nr:MFS transporter [Vicinamibacterales bacterium]
MTSIVRTPCDEGVIRAAGASAPVAAGRWTLIAAILGSGMAFIDGTVATVALPAIAHDLSATVAQMQWVVESYSLMLSSLVLVGGSLGDQFGRRRIFGTGVCVFAAASGGCAISQTIGQLIALRVLQGIGAALLVPGSLALISAAYPEETRGRAIGTWSGFSGITAALGPVIGGWLIENQSWRWAFSINLPIAAAVLAILWRRVPESRGAAEGQQVDWPGAILASVGLGGVVYALIEIPSQGWRNPRILSAFVAGLCSLAAFVRLEEGISAPMLPLGVFRSRTFSGANLLTFLLYAALGAALFFLPLNLIQVQGYSATDAGAALVPLIAIMFALSRWAGGLVARYGSKGPLVLGPIIAAAGFALLGRPTVGGAYWTMFFPAIVVLGFGMVITVAPLTTTVMSSVATDQSGVASGINNAVARTAGLVAVAVLGIVVGAVFSGSLQSRLAARPIPDAVRTALFEQRGRWAGAEVPEGVTREMREALRHDIDEAFVAAFRVAMLACAALALAGAGSAFLFVGSTRPKETEHG